MIDDKKRDAIKAAIRAAMTSRPMAVRTGLRAGEPITLPPVVIFGKYVRDIC
jgi:hypothetical protein